MWRDTVPELKSPEIKRLSATRIIAKPKVLDALNTTSIMLRLAPDDALVLAKVTANELNDPHAIVASEKGFVSVWLKRKEALEFLSHNCEWDLPKTFPAFAQGMVAGLAMKLYFEKSRVLFVVPSPFEKVLAERLS
jgi:hypothetical protein